MKWYKSFRVKIWIMMFIIITLILASAVLYMYPTTKTNVKENVLESNMDIAVVMRDVLRVYLDDLRSVARILASTEQVRSMDFDRINGLLPTVVKENSMISQMYVMDDRGNQFYKTSFLDTLGDRSDREYFQKAIKGEVFFSDVIVSRSTKKPITVLAVPIYDGKNIIGVLGASIELEALSETIGKRKIGETGYAYVVDREGRIIAHPETAYVEEMLDISYLEPVQKVLKGESGVGSYEFDGTRKLVSYIAVMKQGWGVLVQVSEEEAYEELTRVAELFTITFILGTVLSVIGLVILSGYFMKPIKAIANQVEGLTPDDYHIVFKKQRDDEFGIIQRSLKSMAEEIVESHTDLEDKVKDRTKALYETIKKLEETQSKLVEHEKIAALSRLGMQLSHSLNTPIGLSLTEISYLRQRTKDVSEGLGAAKLTKTQMNEYLDETDHILGKIDNQVILAGEMLNSFNEISLEKTFSSKRMVFLRNEIERAQMQAFVEEEVGDATIRITCSENMNVYSYPDIFYMIFLQLFRNSKNHGRVEGRQLEISIDVAMDEENLNMTYKDNGKGIKEEHLDKIFEPFYTSSLSDKNIGLGLSKVYNLAAVLLEGELSCTSDYGENVMFKIIIPGKSIMK